MNVMRSAGRRESLAPVVCLAVLAIACERQPPLPGEAPGAPAPTVQELVGQLEGRHCRFGVDGWNACDPRPNRGLLEALLTRHDDRWTCPTGAARCLGKMGPAAREAVPALLQALASGTRDYDTGDGVIPVRSSVIEALGRTGDPRALDPVADLLPNPSDTFPALEALAALGPLATRRAPDVVTALRTRMADEAGRKSRCDRAMRQLDDQLANQSVVERMQRDNPTQTRFLVPPAEHARALAALDRSTQRYQEDREGHCRDLLGEAALRALGAMRCEVCVDAIIEALATPDLALQAVWTLGSLQDLPDMTDLALRQVRDSSRHGPLSKRAAAHLLERRRP